MDVQNSARAQAVSGPSIAGSARPRLELGDLHGVQFGEFNRPELWVDIDRNELLVALERLGCKVRLYSG
jgi:hypothetical protein